MVVTTPIGGLLLFQFLLRGRLFLPHAIVGFLVTVVAAVDPRLVHVRAFLAHATVPNHADVPRIATGHRRRPAKTCSVEYREGRADARLEMLSLPPLLEFRFRWQNTPGAGLPLQSAATHPEFCKGVPARSGRMQRRRSGPFAPSSIRSRSRLTRSVHREGIAGSVPIDDAGSMLLEKPTFPFCRLAFHYLRRREEEQFTVVQDGRTSGSDEAGGASRRRERFATLDRVCDFDRGVV